MEMIKKLVKEDFDLLMLVIAFLLALISSWANYFLLFMVLRILYEKGYFFIHEKINFNKKTKISLLFLIVSLFLFMTPNLKLPYLDDSTGSFYKDVIMKASSFYAIGRGINAVISVIQESDIDIEGEVGLIANVGGKINFAFGQFLDSLNDVVEDFNDKMLLIIASFTIQKAVFELMYNFMPTILAYIFLLMAFLSFFSDFNQKKVVFFQKAIVFLLVIRFIFPLAAFFSNVVYQSYYQNKLNGIYKKLGVWDGNIEDVLTSAPAEADDFLGKVFGKVLSGFKWLWGFAGKIIAFIKASLANLLENFTGTTDLLLQLLYLQLTWAFIQVILIPLSLFYFFKGILESFNK